MATEDAVRGGATGRGEMQVPALGMGDQAVRDEPPEHLTGSLGGHPEMARDLGGGDASGVVRSDLHAQGEEVFLRGGGQVASVVTSRHDLRIRDSPATGVCGLVGRSR